MNWHDWVRQGQSWQSMASTISIVSRFVGLALGNLPEWLFHLPSGSAVPALAQRLYLFVLPYVGIQGAQRSKSERN